MGEERLTEDSLVKKMRVRFWYEEDKEGFILEIKRKDGSPFTLNQIDNLLQEHKEETEDYTNITWMEFLEDKGFIVEEIAPDFSLYF